MNTHGTFLKRKFFSLFVPGTVSMIVVTILILSDSIIAGLMLGEDAVAAISLVTPAYSLAAFFAGMISIGVPLLYTRAMGEFDKKKALGWFSFGFTTSLIIGVIMFAAFFCLRNLYLSFYEPTESVFTYAKPYLFWYTFTILLLPMTTLMEEMILADGDESLSLCASITQVVGNIVLSIVLSRFFSIAGIGFASFAGTAISLIISFLHFLRPSNSLKIGFQFSFRQLCTVLKYSAIDAGSYLFLACFAVIMERFIVYAYGPEMLILASVMLFIKEVQLVFDGIGEAITPIINIYLGEESCPAIRKCYALAKKTSFIEGVILTLLIIAASPLIVKLYGITSPLQLAYATGGAKIMAFGLIHLSLLYLLTSYYLIIDKILLGFIICGLRDVIISAPLCILLGKCFGIYGLFVSLAVSPILAYSASILYVRVKYGRENTPLLLYDREKSLKEVFFEFLLTPESVIAVQQSVGKFLRENGIEEKSVIKTELLIEELFMLVYERNDKKKHVCAECTAIIREDGIQIITKDDGILFNLSDEDNVPTSLGAFVVASYMEKMKGSKMYLTTLSYNRNTFKIKP